MPVKRSCSLKLRLVINKRLYVKYYGNQIEFASQISDDTLISKFLYLHIFSGTH